MGATSSFGPAQEFEALRTELQESRSYVFEHPLLILGVAVAGVTALGADRVKSVALLPPLVTALMVYNIWTTADRQYSSSRIVAYIQRALEERTVKGGYWWGWETSLKGYRAKLEDAKQKQPGGRWYKKFAERDPLFQFEPERGAVADSLMYWKALWLLHIGSVLAVLLASFALAFCDGHTSGLDLVGWWLTLVLAICFTYVCWRYRPCVMKWLIERNREVWKQVLADLDASGKIGDTAQLDDRSRS